MRTAEKTQNQPRDRDTYPAGVALVSTARTPNSTRLAQIEFLEWTAETHLRHTKFMALREDKPAREVRRE
jgi:bifunctional non-homologous end joining protein LigD